MPIDPGKLMVRVNTVLSLYYDPDVDPETKAEARAEFVRALANYPGWAVHAAFDAWVKSHTRRPSPGEIAILVNRELAPILSELRTRRAAREQEEDKKALRVKGDTAAEIMARAGFTPKRFADLGKNPMALTFSDAEAEPEKKPHWSERADPNGPDMAALRAARDSNPLVQAARAQNERTAAKLTPHSQPMNDGRDSHD